MPMSADAFRRIDVTKQGKVEIAKFKDKKILDETALDEIKVELLRLINDRQGLDLLLDFSQVEFMSSAALGLLGTIHRKVGTTLKGRLKMCSIHPQIYEVFKLTNLNKLFAIHKDMAEALAKFA